MSQKLNLGELGEMDYFYNEAIKSLRTNITFSGNNVQTILFTSSMPGEGKSETSFAVSQAFAGRLLFRSCGWQWCLSLSECAP